MFFYKVWGKRGDFTEVRTLKAFLYISTKNAAFNALNKMQNCHKHHNAYALLNEQADPPVIAEIIRSEVYARLSAAVCTLPGQCRRIIQLLFEEEKKPSEIAEQLGISVSTVNSQKARGLTLLKERFGDTELDVMLILIAAEFLSN